MSTNLKIGDMVTIAFDPSDTCVTEGMKRFNGLNAFVSKVYKSKMVAGRVIPRLYELAGVVSYNNVPYIFTRDMLIAFDEGHNEIDRR